MRYYKTLDLEEPFLYRYYHTGAELTAWEKSVKSRSSSPIPSEEKRKQLRKKRKKR